MMSKTTLGNILLLMGLAAWVTYYVLKFLTPLDPPFAIFLAWHLSGVIPGAMLRGKGRLKSLFRFIRRAIFAGPQEDTSSQVEAS
jgi:hypothetical protein